MKVIVEIIMGSCIDAEVSEDATVKELKEKIAMEVKLPAKRLIIVVGDEETRRIMMEYENEILLRDLGVKEYSHVYLFFKNPDLVSREERFRVEEGDDDSMEEISSEAESRRKDEEVKNEENVKIGNEKEDEKMKDEEEEDGDVKLNNGDEAKDDDDDDDVEEGVNKEENLSKVS